MKHSSTSTCLLGGLLLVCLSSNAAARSISPGPSSQADGDPMIALPSDGHQQHYEQPARYVGAQAQLGAEHQAGAGPQQQEVVYAYQPVATTDDQQAQAIQQHQPQQQQQQQQQVFYKHQQQLAPEQIVHVAAHPAARHEYSTAALQEPADVQIEVNGAPSGAREAATGGEYPGEIVYVDSNGQTSDESSLAGVASALHQNSGLAATILTEVPVREMPYEVLEKLRREYGVKVVATRERPGANLVINCDEHSASRHSSVCSKQARYPQTAPEQQFQYQPQPLLEYHTLEPSEHEQQAQHQAQAQAQFQYQQQQQQQQQPAHVELHEGPQMRSQLIQVSHEVPVEHRPHGRLLSHRGLMAEVVEQPAYQPVATGHEQATRGPEEQPTTVAISEAGEQQQQQPGEQDEYYGSRTATTAPVGEQPSPSEEVQPRSDAEQAQAEQAHAEQAAREQQAALNNQNEFVDQQVGFDEQPKQHEGEQNAYRPHSQ